MKKVPPPLLADSTILQRWSPDSLPEPSSAMKTSPNASLGSPFYLPWNDVVVVWLAPKWAWLCEVISCWQESRVGLHGKVLSATWASVGPPRRRGFLLFMCALVQTPPVSKGFPKPQTIYCKFFSRFQHFCAYSTHSYLVLFPSVVCLLSFSFHFLKCCVVLLIYLFIAGCQF